MKQFSYNLLFVILLCISCKRNNHNSKTLQHQDNLQYQDTVTGVNSSEEASPKNFAYEDIARYTMATIMNQPPIIIKVNKSGDLYIVSYKRKLDSQKFSYKIKFKGTQIIWANLEGRWRDSSADEKIRFAEENNKLKIIQTFNDGSESVKEFYKE